MVFPRTESTYGCSDRGGPERPRSRCDGIALMVVMVVFIVLYMMVYHLSFYTVMEEKIAHVRHGDIQGQDALYSVAQLVMAQLTEDIVQDYSGGAEDPAASGPAAGAGAEAGGAARGGGGGDEGRFVALQTGQQGGVGVEGGSQNFDYLMEAIFNSQQHEVGEVKVKVTITDNERRFDLNRLFEYAPLPAEEDALTGPGGALSGEELAEMAAGTSADTARGQQSLGDKIRSRVGLINRNDDSEEDGEAVNELEGVVGLEDEAELTEFVEPTPQQEEATILMRGRAIEGSLSLNEDRDFFYRDNYTSDRLARDIVDYVIARRTSIEQNRIYHTTELLNITSITR